MWDESTLLCAELTVQDEEDVDEGKRGSCVERLRECSMTTMTLNMLSLNKPPSCVACMQGVHHAAACRMSRPNGLPGTALQLTSGCPIRPDQAVRGSEKHPRAAKMRGFTSRQRPKTTFTNS